ncbi:Imm25 family immunity protein [Sphingobacterium spiritivorum]|uniref:Imm25 family immunity protein n=1 Tax=Sphingobacterium spiritivorum TaxID=258 RepID=UPI001EEA8A68|nr:Imm25 family immunity protein [Sphingobacterium spiritivorum]
MKENSNDNFSSVVAEFGNLISDFGFSCPKKLWYPNLVSLSKNIEDIYYCYVIARAYKNDGSLETTLWVGPINRPDDGLENLSANIKMQIGYTQVLDPLFFQNCESKIITLIESGILKTLLTASKNELNHPSIKNRRYEVYTQYFLPFFLKIIQAAGNDKSIMKDKKKCQVLIENAFTILPSDEKIFFDQLGLKATQDKIWELCYIYSL